MKVTIREIRDMIKTDELMGIKTTIRINGIMFDGIATIDGIFVGIKNKSSISMDDDHYFTHYYGEQFNLTKWKLIPWKDII